MMKTTIQKGALTSNKEGRLFTVMSDFDGDFSKGAVVEFVDYREGEFKDLSNGNTEYMLDNTPLQELEQVDIIKRWDIEMSSENVGKKFMVMNDEDMDFRKGSIVISSDEDGDEFYKLGESSNDAIYMYKDVELLPLVPKEYDEVEEYKPTGAVFKSGKIPTEYNGFKFRVLDDKDSDFPKGSIVELVDASEGHFRKIYADNTLYMYSFIEVELMDSVVTPDGTPVDTSNITMAQILQNLGEFNVGDKFVRFDSSFGNGHELMVVNLGDDTISGEVVKGLEWCDGDNFVVSSNALGHTFRQVARKVVVIPEYEEITMFEALNRLREDSDVYIKDCDEFTLIDIEDEMSFDHDIDTFKDLVKLTKFYKLA